MKSLEDLRRIREQTLESMKIRDNAAKCKIVVAMGTCGIAAGARESCPLFSTNSTNAASRKSLSANRL